MYENVFQQHSFYILKRTAQSGIADLQIRLWLVSDQLIKSEMGICKVNFVAQLSKRHERTACSSTAHTGCSRSNGTLSVAFPSSSIIFTAGVNWLYSKIVKLVTHTHLFNCQDSRKQFKQSGKSVPCPLFLSQRLYNEKLKLLGAQGMCPLLLHVLESK